jgi:hypothetical protein
MQSGSAQWLFVALDGLLATLAAYVTVQAPPASAIPFWVVAFVLLGAARILVGILERRRAAADQKRSNTQILHLVQRNQVTEASLAALQSTLAKQEARTLVRRAALLSRGKKLRDDILAFQHRRWLSSPKAGPTPPPA